MKYQAIAEEIDKMAADDQKAREKFFAQNDQSNENFEKMVDPIDEINNGKIKNIIDRIGYPTISKVGKKASFNAWLIIQHSPQIEFMKKCLKLMEDEKDDIDPLNIAYLKDRVLMYSGKKQIYGTQLKQNSITKKMELYDVEDIEHLDERRRSIGLDPITDI